MKAITVEPGKPGTVRYEEIPEPSERCGIAPLGHR